jgi:hypothetical protein
MPSAILVNFAGGETSPKSRGRFDIQSYSSSCKKLVNFIAEVSGPARFRPGFRFIERARDVATTTGYSRKVRIVPYQINAGESYVLEFTRGKMRVYRDGALQSIARTTVSGVTDVGGEAKVMVASVTGLTDEDEVVISGVLGAVELNDRVFRIDVDVSGGAGFFVIDPLTGSRLLFSDVTTYVSGGSVSEVVTLASPYYTDEDFVSLNYAQTPGALYIASYRHPPYKAVVDPATGTWTLAVYSRTSDPFVATAAINVTGKSEDSGAGKTYITLASAAVDEHLYTLAAVGGVPDLNAKWRLKLVANVGGSPTYEVLDPTTSESVFINGTYTSGGTATPDADNPISVAFYESRLVFAGTNFRPNTLFLSRAPSSTGGTRYDDFTGGTDADHACFFTLAPVNGQIDHITWAAGTAKYLLIGSFGGAFRVSGGGLDEPITPSSINVRQIDSFGCAASPVAMNGAVAHYIQRGGATVRTVKYAADTDDLGSFDACLNAEQVGYSPLRRVLFQAGRPDMIWVLRDDGVLASVTVSGTENIAGWHRHFLGGTDVKVTDVAVLPRPGLSDQLWAVVERTSPGITPSATRFIEVMADDVVFPDPEDFFTAEGSQAANETDYMDAVYRLQERYIHVDSAATYNGSDIGNTPGAYLTISQTSVGTGRTISSTTAIFTTADVGKEIWFKPSATTGIGAGRALITAFVSSTSVTVEITVAFSAATVPAGDWYLAADEISGLWHLEGERVAVVADGAVYSDGKTADYPTVTVASGAITLSRNCAVVHVGLPYEGMLITHNLEMGGQSGPAQDKPRNIARMVLRFLNSLGCEYGTDLYHTKKVVHNSNKYVSDRPTPVFSGQKIVHNSDDWRPDSGDKNVVVVQKLPLPCVLQFVGVYYDIGDEG